MKRKRKKKKAKNKYFILKKYTSLINTIYNKAFYLGLGYINQIYEEIHWYSVTPLKPNYLKISNCHLTITKKYNNLKFIIVIYIILIQLIIT